MSKIPEKKKLSKKVFLFRSHLAKFKFSKTAKKSPESQITMDHFASKKQNYFVNFHFAFFAHTQDSNKQKSVLSPTFTTKGEIGCAKSAQNELTFIYCIQTINFILVSQKSHSMRK